MGSEGIKGLPLQGQPGRPGPGLDSEARREGGLGDWERGHVIRPRAEGPRGRTDKEARIPAPGSWTVTGFVDQVGKSVLRSWGHVVFLETLEQAAHTLEVGL